MTHDTAFAMHTVPATVKGGDAPGEQGAPAPHWADMARGTTHTLPEGMRLQDYEIVAPIGEGGFGIVYLAWDHRLEQHVAIKEYLPAVLASRASVSPAVIVKSQRHMHSFHAGMRSFVNEARMLARFDHPSLVRVLHFWEGNGTAYMSMPYYVGPTLARALAELGRPPDEAEIISWLRPLVDALQTMHAAHCFHRDIAPDNILLTENGPVLLDFGAARRVIDGAGPSPTAVFKPGFAPIEQYGEGASMKQGAWTDLYALAGVVYTAITGKPPTPSVERLMGDALQPLSELARGRYSARFLGAIDAALSLHPRNRPHSASEFWTQLNGEAPANAPTGDRPPANTAVATPREAAPKRTPPAVVGDIDVDALFAEVPDVPAPRAAPRVPRAEPVSARIEPTAFTTPAPGFESTPLGASEPPRRASGSAQGRSRAARVFALSAVPLLLAVVVAGYFRVGDPVLVAPPPQPSAAAPSVASSAPNGAPDRAGASAPTPVESSPWAPTPDLFDTPPGVAAALAPVAPAAAAAAAVAAPRWPVAKRADATEVPRAVEIVPESGPLQPQVPLTLQVAEPASREPAAIEPAAIETSVGKPASAESAVIEPSASKRAAIEPPAVEPVAIERPVIESAAAVPTPGIESAPTAAPSKPKSAAVVQPAAPEYLATQPAPKTAPRTAAETSRPPRRESRVAVAEATRRPAEAEAAPAPQESARLDPRCTEILQRASLGPLRPSDAAFLRKGCE